MLEHPETTDKPQGRLSLRTMCMPADSNPAGHIFGGWLMAQMDLAGGTHAFHRAQGRVVTVAVDAMTFMEPVEVGDELSCYTEIMRIGKTSMSIKVEAWVRRRCVAAKQIKVTSATFTYVAVHDKERAKREIPAVTPELD